MNEELINALLEVSEYYSLVDGAMDPEWKGKAIGYKKAANQIKAVDHSILTIEDLPEMKFIKGSITADIRSFLTTGEIPRLEEMKSMIKPEDKAVIDLFESVLGIGVVTAVDLYLKKYRTLDDLKHLNLTTLQRAGVDYYEDFRTPIPRAYIAGIDRMLQVIANNRGWVIEITGSYRRGEMYSGDIDILVTGNNVTIDDVLREMYVSGIDVLRLTKGPKKFMGMLTTQPRRKVDIRVFSAAEYPTALLHSTGSGTFNILMRNRAIDLVMKLNEYGLYYYDGHRAPITSERDIFIAMDVEYLQPNERRKDISRLRFGTAFDGIA